MSITTNSLTLFVTICQYDTHLDFLFLTDTRFGAAIYPNFKGQRLMRGEAKILIS